jgi:hypothetical protein
MKEDELELIIGNLEAILGFCYTLKRYKIKKLQSADYDYQKIIAYLRSHGDIDFVKLFNKTKGVENGED